jgi:hypothetical protein
VSAPRITYVLRPDATQEDELNALAAAYRFILECHAQKRTAEPSPESNGCDDTAIVRNMEGVSHVEQRPN